MGRSEEPNGALPGFFMFNFCSIPFQLFKVLEALQLWKGRATDGKSVFPIRQLGALMQALGAIELGTRGGSKIGPPSSLASWTGHSV
jgi:hypothetical protein